MRNSILTIMHKELSRLFGDRRMAITTILLPGILIYIIYSFMGNALTGNFESDKDYKPSIYVSNIPESIKQLSKASKIDLQEIDKNKVSDIKSKIKSSDADLLLIFPDNFDLDVSAYVSTDNKPAPNIELFYNTSSTNSQSAYTLMTSLLDSYESSMINKFDINNTNTKYDLAEDKDLTGQFFSSMLPMLLLIFMFSGCLAVAPESIAGEKERGTIATMLITPTKREDIALGKILSLSIIAVLSGISSTIGTILSLPKLMGQNDNNIVSNVYNAGDYLCLALVIISTVLVIVTAVSIISAFAKTVKEAQTYISPLMILTILVGITAMFGKGIQNNFLYYLIPLYNSVQSMVGIFSFNIVPGYIILTAISNIVYTGIGVLILTKMFNSEKIIFSK